MALQLIDLNEDIEYINIDASKVPYSFSIKLTDVQLYGQVQRYRWVLYDRPA